MNDSSNRHMRGQALLQFALVAPMLLLLMFSVIDFGRVFYNQISNPAAAGDWPPSPSGCHYLALEPSPFVGGSVVVIDPGTLCPEDDRFYAEDTVVIFLAIPNSGYHFIQWIDDASGTNITGTVTMDENKSVTAVFELRYDCYRLDLEPSPYYSGRVVVIDPGTECPEDSRFYDDGAVVTLLAIPYTHYDFDRWEGDASGTNITTTVTMTEDKSVTAVFDSPYECHFLDASIIPYSAAGVIVAITPYNCEADFRGGWFEDTLVRLQAMSRAGYSFVEWSGDANGSSNPLDVIVTAEDMQITARFSCDECDHVFLPVILKQ